MLLDSNIIIYAAQPAHAELRQFIADHAPAVSVISQIEVLGYHGLTPEDRHVLETFFATATALPVDDAVVAQAIALRQQRRLSLGDALIAATALVHRRRLVTRNTGDFDWIENLELLNPLAP